MKQRQVGRAKSAAACQRNLGNSRLLGNLQQGLGLGTLQLAVDSKSTVRYLDIEVDDALEMAEQMDA